MSNNELGAFLMKAIDYIAENTKGKYHWNNGNQFDYSEFCLEELGMNIIDTGNFLDKFGSDNDESEEEEDE